MLETVQKAKPTARPRTPDLASETASLLLEVVPFAMRRLRKEVRRARRRDLTLPQFRILALLWCEPSSNKALAETLGVSVPATSRMVKLLAGRNLVESTQGTRDKRQVEVRLTSAGSRCFAETKEAVRAALSEELRNLSDGNLRQAQSGLHAIKAILDQRDPKRT
jgi:DNA-binding MarR family transcriptional regulator